MQKVLIIGCPGSGKSTFARTLSPLVDLPLFYIDQLYWNADRTTVGREILQQRLQKILATDRWILDGNYDRTMGLRLEKCDTVIYLDYSRMVCIAQWLKRVITNWGKTRQDMAPGCAEWFDPEFLGWIWNFNKTHRKQYYEMLSAQKEKTVHIFKNRRQLNRYLRSL